MTMALMTLRTYRVVSKSQGNAECILCIISSKPTASGQTDLVQVLAVATF